jgi:uncharacterized phage infection (PIP) family protein YhgE
MEDLLIQISKLQNQIHGLDLTIESMPKQIITELLNYISTNNVNLTNNSVNSISHISRESIDYSFAHKDIIEEDNSVLTGGTAISSEWQVSRLTAQLTYAYERIAALEKQLLSRHLASR